MFCSPSLPGKRPPILNPVPFQKLSLKRTIVSDTALEKYLSCSLHYIHLCPYDDGREGLQTAGDVSSPSLTMTVMHLCIWVVVVVSTQPPPHSEVSWGTENHNCFTATTLKTNMGLQVSVRFEVKSQFTHKDSSCFNTNTSGTCFFSFFLLIGPYCISMWTTNLQLQWHIPLKANHIETPR